MTLWLLILLGIAFIGLAFLVAAGNPRLVVMASFLGAVGGGLIGSSVVRLIFQAVQW